jgi:hypothetical protein
MYLNELDRAFGLTAERRRNRSVFKKNSLVKRGAVKGVDDIINGGRDKPTEWGCVQERFYCQGNRSINCDMRVRRGRLTAVTWGQSAPEWRQLIVFG